MTDTHLRKLENDLVAYMTDCDRKSPPSLESIPSHLLNRGIMLAVHIPSIFPQDKYSSADDFLSRIVRELHLEGAYEFRTEGFYKSHKDYDHFRIVSYIKVREIPGMIRHFKERLKVLQKETKQKCIFLSVGLSSAFFDCWSDKDPNLLFEQKTLQEFGKSKEKQNAQGAHPLLINPPKLVVVRGFNEGGFMDRLKMGITSMAHQFGTRINWIEISEHKTYAQALREAIELSPDAIVIHHGHTGNDLEMKREIEDIADHAIKSGIKMVVFDTNLPINEVTYISQDDMFMSILLARKIDTDFYNQSKVGVLYINDIREYLPLQKRDFTWNSAKECYPRISEVSNCNINVDLPPIEKQMLIRDALLKHLLPGSGNTIEAIVAMWDEFAKPAVRAVKELVSEGRLKENRIKVYSMDLVEEDLEMMKEERKIWAATVATDPYQIGRVIVRAAIIRTSGESLKSLIMESSLITSDNLFELPAHSISDLHVFRSYCESQWA
jgi:simple sugar transport system substrate-binding protein